MLLKYFDMREVKTPERAHATDAGIDFYMPEIDDKFIEDFLGKNPVFKRPSGESKGELNIPPGINALIPSGIKVEIPHGYMGLFLNKSGVASKKNLLIGAQVIDTFYSGEIHIDLHNVGTEPVTITAGMKLAQMVLVPVLSCELTLTDEEDLYDWMKQDGYRGEGGFGSTDKKS